eukprot:1140889-Pelagomonas_calceolata.AAC.1
MPHSDVHWMSSWCLAADVQVGSLCQKFGLCLFVLSGLRMCGCFITPHKNVSHAQVWQGSQPGSSVHEMDPWMALQPFRDNRPINGGTGCTEEMVTLVRSLNFELD